MRIRCCSPIMPFTEHEMVDNPGGDRVQHHPMHAEDFAHVLQMFLVAAQPVDILDDDGLGLPRHNGRQQPLQPGPLHRRAGNAIVAMPCDELQAVALGIGPGEGLLIGNRGGALVGIV